MNSNELLAVIESMEKERGIPREALIQMVEAALLSASKKSMGSAQELRIDIDKKTLNIRVFAQVEVVDRAKNRNTQISIITARKTKPDAKSRGAS